MTSHPLLHRRELLQVGVSSLLGIGLPSLLAGQVASRQPSRGKSRSVILVLLTGGASHIDMLDMKPAAPAEIRGEFKPIPTAVPGLQVCEHLPRLAARMKRWALVRSLSHGENGHLQATHRPRFAQVVGGGVVGGAPLRQDQREPQRSAGRRITGTVRVLPRCA